MVRTRLCGALLLTMAVALAGCDDTTSQACTEIGCSDGLRVTLRQAPGVELQVVASTGAGDERTGTCVVEPDGSCEVRFYDFVPEEVTIAVFGGDQPVSVTLQPAYGELQPNGPGCPPICRQATVELNLGAASR